MTSEDIALNKSHPARRLGAAGLVLAVARWRERTAYDPNDTSTADSYFYGLTTSALAEWRLCEREYRGYQYGLAEGRRLALKPPRRPCVRCGEMAPPGREWCRGCLDAWEPDTEDDDAE